MQYSYFDSLDRDLISLYCLIKSEKKIDELIMEAGTPSGILIGMSPAQERLLEDLLLNTSLRLRLLDDIFRSDGIHIELRYLDVGKLTQNDIESELDQRGVENKIIHSKHFQVSGKLFWGHGMHNNQRWSALIDLEKYCLNGLSKIVQYKEGSQPDIDEVHITSHF